MKKLALILALLLPSLASAQQTQSSVQTQINTNITTNGQNQITGAKLNSVLTAIGSNALAVTGTSAQHLGLQVASTLR